MSVVKTELKAKDVMTTEPVCVGSSTTIRELARVFEDNEISGAPVVDEAGAVIGIVSKTDLIRRCSEGTADIPPAHLFEVLCEQGADEGTSEAIPEPLVCVQDFMTEDPVMVSPEVSAAAVAREMFERRIHRVIVVDEEKFPVGMITSLDLLGVFSQGARIGHTGQQTVCRKEAAMSAVMRGIGITGTSKRATVQLAGGLDRTERLARTAAGLETGRLTPARSPHGGNGVTNYEHFCTDWFMPEPDRAASTAQMCWSVRRWD